MPNDRPNILLILLDQVRRDAIGCYGSTICRTPNIDALAADGLRFDAAYTSISLCSPARASMFSGLLSHRHGMLYNTTGALYGRTDLAPGVKLLSSHLLAGGYSCGYAGKWHIDRKGPRGHGFVGTECPGFGLPGYVREYDEWLQDHGIAGQRSVRVRDYATPEEVIDCTMPTPYGFDGVIDLPTELTPAGFVAARTIDLIEQSQDQPFFITASFWGPHHPALPTEEFEGLYPAESVPPWPNFDDKLDGKPNIQKRYARTLNRNFTGKPWSVWARTVARHYAFLSMIDTQVGRILRRLEELGLDRNTTVIFSSDHGDTLGCHGGQFDKGPYMYEETYAVPLLIRFPGGEQAGQATSAPVSNLDLFSTVLDLAGVDLPPDVDAVSLAPFRYDRNITPREHVLAHFNGFDTRGMYLQRMLHTGRCKYVFNPGDFDELYNLESDPHELSNLIDAPAAADLRQDLRERLATELERTRDPHAQHVRDFLALDSPFLANPKVTS